VPADKIWSDKDKASFSQISSTLYPRRPSQNQFARWARILISTEAIIHFTM